MICIYIEDNKKIREGVLDFYLKTIPYNYESIELEVINFPLSNEGLSKGYVREQLIELILCRPEEETFVIFTDYGIKTGPKNEDYIYITDIFREIANVDDDLFKQINEIVIYSYQLGENLSFYEDIDKFKIEYSNSLSVIDFETSVTFNKRQGSKLYNLNNGLWKLKESLLPYYSRLIAETLLEFVGGIKNNGVNLLSNSTRELNQYIYFMNALYFNKDPKKFTSENDISDYKISFISFINPTELDSKYGLDAPYKPYYKEINDYIESYSLSNIFKRDKTNYYKGSNYIYFRIYKNESIKSNGQFELNVFSYTERVDNNNIPEYFKNQTNLSKLESFQFWIKATYFSIYHQDVDYNNNYSTIIDYFNKNVTINFITSEDVDDKREKNFTEYFWFFHELEIDSFGYKGLLNYAFHRETGNIASTSTTKQINSDAHKLYSQRKPLIISKILDTLYPYFNENLRQHSLLNALSTVLNRNGSHNLGSHVLAILSSEDLVKQFLEKDRDTDTSQNYGDIIYDAIYYKHINWSGKDTEKQTIESLVAYFNAYLKNRLDLLAAVGTSGEAVMLNNKPLFKGVFKNFERNLVLLEHISGKDTDFKYKFCLTVNDTICIDNDIEVAMPNDLLGDQAFYLLLENIIRNTAKHGTYDSYERIIFTINVNTTESDDDFYAIEIWDNNCLDSRALNECKSSSIIDLEGQRKYVIDQTNGRIDKDILQDDFNIREGGWGTIEMKIACCYLSGLPLRKIDDDAYRTDTYRTDAVNNRLPIIEAFDKAVVVNNEIGHHLGYRFYIQKPKSVLVVDVDAQLNEDERKAKSLTKKGIAILTNDELKEAITKRTIYKHQFMVAFAKAETDATSKLKEWYSNKQLPNRVMVLNENREVEGFEIKNSLINENLLETCYKQILKKVEPTKTKDNPSTYNKYLININDKFDLYYHIFPAKKFLNAKQKNGLAYQYEAKFTHHSTVNKTGKIVYCEPYGSVSSLGLMLTKENIKVSLNNVYHTLLEAVSMRILVIDERIQNGMTKTFKPDSDEGEIVTFEKIYSDTRVIVPNKDEANLNKPKEEIKKVKKYIFDVLKNNQVDYFILHFGILEKIVSNATKDGFNEFLTECREIQKDYPLKIVLTSGRGIPSDLPDDEYFCNFSSIDYYLSDTNGRSKAHLVQLLKNQRIK